MRPAPGSHSPIAQLVEHSTVNRMVAGSSPARGASVFNELPAKTATSIVANHRVRKTFLETRSSWFRVGATRHLRDRLCCRRSVSSGIGRTRHYPKDSGG